VPGLDGANALVGAFALFGLEGGNAPVSAPHHVFWAPFYSRVEKSRKDFKFSFKITTFSSRILFFSKPRVFKQN